MKSDTHPESTSAEPAARSTRAHAMAKRVTRYSSTAAQRSVTTLRYALSQRIRLAAWWWFFRSESERRAELLAAANTARLLAEALERAAAQPPLTRR